MQREIEKIKKWLLKAGIICIIFSVFLVWFAILGSLVVVLDESESSNEGDTYYYINGTGCFAKNVEAYRSLIEQLCKEYNTVPSIDLTQYVNAMLAMMQIESGGSGTDPMQASECGYNTQFPRKANAITDPEYSCRCGVQYFRDAFVLFKVESPADIERLAAAAQGYNFGIQGWYNWLSKKGGKYSVELAKEYSETKMPIGQKGTPTHGQKFINVYQTVLASGSNSSDKLDNIVYYKQWDERWATYPYGSSTIQYCGCGITCMAMVVATFCDSTVTPPVIADLSMANGGYVPGAGSAMPVVVSAASKYYSFQYESISADDIGKYISEKKALIIWGCNTGYFSNSAAGHVMIIRNVTSDGKYLLADPNRIINNTTAFELDFIKNEAKGYYIAIWKK